MSASILSRLTNEAFWQRLLGQRLFALLARFAGNDAIFVGTFLSLGPTVYALLAHVYIALLRALNRIMYVSIEVTDEEPIYVPIRAFVNNQLEGIDIFKNVSGVTKYNSIRPTNRQFDEERLSLGVTPQIGTQAVIHYKGYKIWVTRTRLLNPEQSRNSRRTQTKSYLLRMRSKNVKLLQSLIQEWVEVYYDQRNSQTTIYKCINKTNDRSWREACTKDMRSFDSVILKANQKEEILDDLLAFKTQKDWYLHLGIPYRRGYLLHGPPGTGKTSFIQTVARKLHMNIALLSAATPMDDESFANMMMKVPKNSIIVMEDIDHCTLDNGGPDKGSGGSGGQRVTVSGLLNALDGIYSQEGSLVFLTANEVSKIPPALLRPGRVDVKTDFGYADRHQIECMFWRFFGERGKQTDDVELNQALDKVVGSIPENHVTTAELQNFFMAYAMVLNGKQRTSIMTVTGLTNSGHLNGSGEALHKKPSMKQCLVHLVSSIPDFLKHIAMDREQAQKHTALKEESDGTQQ